PSVATLLCAQGGLGADCAERSRLLCSCGCPTMHRWPTVSSTRRKHPRCVPSYAMSTVLWMLPIGTSLPIGESWPACLSSGGTKQTKR
ncbi:hypothetical protein EV180_005691, partial [Coemansia sp. RSA 518]